MKKIDLACKNFNNICDNNKKGKFGFLPDWLLYSSNRLEKETYGNRYRYQRYRRGSIIFVNFGVNLGYELSGNHFAIVLNKDDNPLNGVLTVLPLSSKNKPHYLALGNTLLDAASGIILSKAEKLNTEWKELEVKENSTAEERYRLIMDTEQMKQVLTRYQKLNEDTYAMMENITTVSKFKVLKPMNKYDPIGRIRASDTVLNIIDLFFVNQYTNLLNCLDDEKLKQKLEISV